MHRLLNKPAKPFPQSLSTCRRFGAQMLSHSRSHTRPRVKLTSRERSRDKKASSRTRERKLEHWRELRRREVEEKKAGSSPTGKSARKEEQVQGHLTTETLTTRIHALLGGQQLKRQRSVATTTPKQN